MDRNRVTAIAGKPAQDLRKSRRSEACPRRVPDDHHRTIPVRRLESTPSTGAGASHKTVGAGLLAKTVCQPTSMLHDTPLSRASPLPHLFGVVSGAGDQLPSCLAVIGNQPFQIQPFNLPIDHPPFATDHHPVRPIRAA